MEKPLKILHIGNGTAFKIKAIVDAFLARGHEIHMVPLPAIAPQWPGVTWHALPEPRVPGPLRVPARILQLRRLARRLQPDVVHAHNAWGPGWYGAFTGLHPLVIHAYGGDLLPERYEKRPALERRLTSWTCRTADRIIVTGRHMIDASAGLAFPRERLMLLPRGVDLGRYRPGLDTTPLRRSLNLPDGAGPIVLSPRYQANESLYNLDIVIEAFAEMRRAFPNAICVQLFDPKCEAARADLERAASSRGLGSAYRMIPAVSNEEMPLLYNLADVVVSVPSTDGFPVTVLEASACASALVVSRLPYCSEWFEDGQNGVLVPVRDAAALAEALVTVCRDEGLRQRVGAAGRRMVEERADYQRCMDTLELEYRRLVASTRPTSATGARAGGEPAPNGGVVTDRAR